MSNLSPKKIVEYLNTFIIGQNDAKKSVAIALRNRWRRKQLTAEQQKEILPKNILMIGPTGVGKTEIARRLCQLDDSPFIKVEATKFTEVGYIGRDVEQIIRDLLDNAIHTTSIKVKESLKSKAELVANNKIIDILVGKNAEQTTKDKFLTKLKAGDLDSSTIEIQVLEKSGNPPFMDIPGMPNSQVSLFSLGSIMGADKKKKKSLKTTVKEAIKILVEEECENLLDQDSIVKKAITNVENNGLVFIDEIDKIINSSEHKNNSNVSREGVQRDLLPLVEGTTVSTKYGLVNTDHILFIASGAFHISSPADLLPELQGRFPIRVELKALSKNDLVRILKEPKNNLLSQYKMLLATEDVTLKFEDDAVVEIAALAEQLNTKVENIGARRLQTILEKTLEDISFDTSKYRKKEFAVTKKLVQEKVAEIALNEDISKYIL